MSEEARRWFAERDTNGDGKIDRAEIEVTLYFLCLPGSESIFPIDPPEKCPHLPTSLFLVSSSSFSFDYSSS
jgi:hypothetical protein